MGAVYRERIDDSRLLAVSDHLRKWLFGEKEPVSQAIAKGTMPSRIFVEHDKQEKRVQKMFEDVYKMMQFFGCRCPNRQCS